MAKTPTPTAADDGSIKTSINLADMSLEQLVQVSQGIGHQVERLREQRAHLKLRIDERLAKGERTSMELRDDEPAGGGTGAVAPGAVIDMKQGG